MKVKDILTSPAKWHKGAMFRDISGRLISDPVGACSYCLFGAIFACNEDFHIRQRIVEKVCSELRVPRRDANYITSWNDLPTTRFEDVRALIEKLDI